MALQKGAIKAGATSNPCKIRGKNRLISSILSLAAEDEAE